MAKNKPTPDTPEEVAAHFGRPHEPTAMDEDIAKAQAEFQAKKRSAFKELVESGLSKETAALVANFHEDPSNIEERRL